MTLPPDVEAPGVEAPRVSVLMPVRDARWLPEAIGTIREQSLRRIEIVVVDDGMAPESRDWLAAVAAKDARLRVVDAPPRHRGLAEVLNAGLDAVTAPLTARADADDRYLPDRLARQLAAFDARPALAALSCGYHRIDAGGRRLHTHRPVTGAGIIRFRAMFSNSLLHPGVMFRTDLVRRAGGYDPRFWTAQDSDLWARLAALGELDNLPEPLIEWREHGGSVLATRGAAGRALSLQISRRLQEAYLGRELDPEDVAAAVETWRSHLPVPRDRLARGERQLVRILAAAERREAPATIRDLRRRLAWVFWRQVRFAALQRPVDAVRLLPASAHWAVPARRAGHPAGDPAVRGVGP